MYVALSLGGLGAMLGVWHAIRPPEHADAVTACVLRVCRVDGCGTQAHYATYARDRVLYGHRMYRVRGGTAVT